MLRNGHARVDAVPGLSCMRELLAHEREGMTRDRGLWTNPAYRVRWADAPQRLMRLRNSFQLVEGTVRKVAVTRSRVYLNFGDDWRSDFTAGAARRSPAFQPNEIAALEALEGLRVRIRGWIERRNGPYIELHNPLQIEALEGQSDAPAAGVAQGPRETSRTGRHQVDTPVDGALPDRPPTQERPEQSVPGVLDL